MQNTNLVLYALHARAATALLRTVNSGQKAFCPGSTTIPCGYSSSVKLKDCKGAIWCFSE